MYARRLITGVFALVLLSLSTFAQDAPPDRAGMKAWANDYLRYFGYDTKVTAQEIEQLADWRLKVVSPSSTLEERQAALKEFVTWVFRLTKPDPMPPEQAITNFANNTGRTYHLIVTTPSAKPVGTVTTPLGQLGHVEKRGRGPIPMILIADARMDWTLFQSFMDRNAERYTMYAVTLPGNGGTPPPPKPAPLDLSKTPWWDGAEKGVLDLIAKNRINKPVVVGMPASSLLAARLAIKHPDKIRAAVLLNGLAYAPFARSLSNPDIPATLAERPQVIRKQPGVIGMLQEFAPQLMTSREATESRINALPPNNIPTLGNTRDVERARALAVLSNAGSDPRAYRYNTEFFASDLSCLFKDLKVPVLSIAAVPDDNSPGQGSPEPGQWSEIKLKYPTIPLTVAHFQNTRAYITEEAPQELDKAIEAFLAGKPIEAKKGRVIAARPSPRAAVMQALGAGEISITYGRPQVNKRDVWGKLVPYNRVWRTGANEATEIAFSSDVLIDGQKLAAGKYTLFTIPTENEWTVIFNKVTNQWGHFSYNPEFDVLKVKAKPQAAEHQEYVQIGFENLTATSVQVVVHWEKIKVPFKVELEPVKTASGN